MEVEVIDETNKETKLEVIKLSDIMLESRNRYYGMQKKARDEKREDKYAYDRIQAELLEKQQQALELEDENSGVKKQLNRLKKEHKNKLIDEEHMHRQLHTLMKRHRNVLDTCRIALLEITEETSSNTNEAIYQITSPWQQLKKHLGLQHTSAVKRRRDGRKKRTMEVLDEVVGDFDNIVKSVDEFHATHSSN